MELDWKTSCEAVHTTHVQDQVLCDGDSIDGLQVMFVHMVKRAKPGPFTNRRFEMVCFAIGHSGVALVQVSIFCKLMSRGSFRVPNLPG